AGAARFVEALRRGVATLHAEVPRPVVFTGAQAVPLALPIAHGTRAAHARLFEADRFRARAHLDLIPARAVARATHGDVILAGHAVGLAHDTDTGRLVAVRGGVLARGLLHPLSVRVAGLRRDGVVAAGCRRWIAGG